jgi:cytoskeletal protein CcmA (bactofilin family)
MDNDLDLAEISRPADVQLRRLPSFPEDKHERPAPASQGKHEGHVLVGEGIKIVGEIRDCRKIEIYGVVEGDLEAEELIVHGNGLLKGNVKTDRAQVHGSIDGDITVTHLLDVKAKGSVAGKTLYGQLSIETGGRIVGTLDDRSAPGDDRAVGAVADQPFKASATG